MIIKRTYFCSVRVFVESPMALRRIARSEGMLVLRYLS